MTKRQQDFLLQLAGLCELYEATFTYTQADDGIHINAEGNEVFVGFLLDAPSELREAVLCASEA